MSGSCDPTDCSLPGSYVHGILQERILEWVAMPSTRGSSWPKNRSHISCISCIGRWVLYHCTTWESLICWLWSKCSSHLGCSFHWCPCLGSASAVRTPSDIGKSGLTAAVLKCSVYICSFVAVQSLSHVWYFGTPGTIAGQASLSVTISWSLLKLMSIESQVYVLTSLLNFQFCFFKTCLLLPWLCLAPSYLCHFYKKSRSMSR